MNIKKLEAEALRLPESERVALAKRLLASVGTTEDEDPVWGLGRNPVSVDVVDGSGKHDQYLYDHLA